MAFALGSRARATGARLAAPETSPSTNSDAIARVRAGEQGPFWVVTSHQTAGRGRRYRPWISPPGNLAASVIETVDAPLALVATLGFAAGLALDAALRKLSQNAAIGCDGSDDAVFSLKWPNDVLLGGAKVAGILLETEPVRDAVAVVTGMGVNIVAAPQDTPYQATSLAAHDIAMDAEAMFGALSDTWSEFFDIWNHGRGFSDIRMMWLERATGLGEKISVHHAGRVLQGSFETIDAAGCLVMTDGAGTQVSVAAGDVYFGAATTTGGR